MKLSTPQRRVLERLSVATGSMTVGKLAEHLGTSPAPTLKTLRSLQRLELVYQVNTNWWNPTARGLDAVKS